jgi:signal transduction histidine kinase
MPPVLAPMPPPERSSRMLLLVFGTGVAFGLQSAILHYVRWHSRTAFALFLISSLFFSGLTYVLWQWVFPHLRKGSFARQIVLQLAVSLVGFGLLAVLVTEVVTSVLGSPSLFGPPTGPELHVVLTPEMRQAFARAYILIPLVPALLITMLGYHQYWHRILALQHRERELTELAATAQLAALRAQINPHFLFNSLNSIAQLIRSDPDKAETCVERLAEIFRYILRRAEKEFVPLADELEMTEAYLDIERARFGERLHVETHVDPASRRQLIPNLILQPLVENAVKHGLSRKMGTGTVRIEAQVTNGFLRLTVGDDGLGMAGTALASVYERGVGLRNLRDRLARLYGPAYLPEIVSAPDAGTQVRLSLPVLAGAAA